jgi:GTP cyclohydrolase II
MMNFFSVDDIRSNRVSRILSDLRRGVPVIINKKHLLVSVETLSESNFNKLKRTFKDKFTLIVQSLAQDSSQLSFEAIKSFCNTQYYNNLHQTENAGAVRSQKLNTNFCFDDEVCRKILTLAKLLPVFLFVELDSTNNKLLNESDILNLEEDDFASYIKSINTNVEEVTSAIPIPFEVSNEASITIFRVPLTGEEHYAITIGKIKNGIDPLIRLHSSCYTGDLLQSLRCDCNSQLLAAKKIMSESPENAGVIIYLAQEGRGIGLANKLRAYALQDNGCDTVEANELLGFEIDGRDYSVAAAILKKLKITRARLLSNNPKKTKALNEKGILISQTLPLTTKINRYNKSYIETKRKKLAHTI